MKKIVPPALLAVAAVVAFVLMPMSARAITFPLYVSNNSGAFGNTIAQFGSGGASSPFASTD